MTEDRFTRSLQVSVRVKSQKLENHGSLTFEKSVKRFTDRGRKVYPKSNWFFGGTGEEISLVGRESVRESVVKLKIILIIMLIVYTLIGLNKY